MYSHTKYQLIVFFLFASISCCGGKKLSKSIYFFSSNTTFNPNHMTHYAMGIRRDNRVADVYMGIANTFTSDMWLSVSVTQVTNARLHSKPMFAYDLNLCELLTKKGTGQRGFLTPWLKNFWSQSNLPQSCPLKKGNYTWIGLSMGNLTIPLIIPTSKYDVLSTTYIRKNKQRDMVGILGLLMEIK